MSPKAQDWESQGGDFSSTALSLAQVMSGAEQEPQPRDVVQELAGIRSGWTQLITEYTPITCKPWIQVHILEVEL